MPVPLDSFVGAPKPSLDSFAHIDSGSAAPPPPPSGISLFGNPLADIKSAGEAVYNAVAGQGPNAGQSPIRRGFSAAESAANAIPSVIADVVPGGKPALNAVGALSDAAIHTAANIPNTLADAAESLGLMSKEQRKAYDERNATFANSPLGHALEAAASVGNSAGNIANVILAAHGAAAGTQDFLDNKVPAIKEAVANAQDEKAAAAEREAQAAQDGLVKKTADEIGAVESKYASTRNANDYSNDAGRASRQRISQSGVLKYTIDNDGVIRTTDPGGAVDQYRAMTTDPAEGVVRSALMKEGSKVLVSDIETTLKQQVENSGLEGADLVSALNGVKREVAGIRLKADAKGYVPTAVLQDAKINTTKNINYQTPPETATFRKAVARGYKALIEDNSNFNVREVNAELAKYYDDISRLERLDGKRVSGGRLGKYAAQITGNIVGGALGSLFGPFGTALGSIAGGEVTSAVKGVDMSSRFNSDVVPTAPRSPVLEEAVRATKTP